MKVYTVHLRSAGALSEHPQDVALAPEGFSWAAFLFGPFWLLASRLWAWAAVWIIVAAAYFILAHFLTGWIAEPALIAGALLAEVLFGFEAHDLRRRALEGSAGPTVDVVCAGGADSAARLFFRRRVGAGSPAVERSTAEKTPPPLPTAKGFLSMFPDERAP